MANDTNQNIYSIKLRKELGKSKKIEMLKLLWKKVLSVSKASLLDCDWLSSAHSSKCWIRYSVPDGGTGVVLVWSKNVR